MHKRALFPALLLSAWIGVSAAAQDDTDPHHAHHGGHTLPTEPGESVFATVQEMMALLEADPATDWSRVDLDALREHLIDMDLAATRASVQREAVPGGLRVTATGDARTLAALRRMIPAHAGFMDGTNGWRFVGETLADAVVLTVTGQSEADAIRIRALGYMGLLALGDHHPAHHLALAKGMPAH